MNAESASATNATSQRTAAIGLLSLGAALVTVSGFLDWVSFETQDFFPVRPLSGFADGGGGLWAIGAATVVVILAVMLSAGLGGYRGVRIAVNILFGCVLGAAVLAGQAFYSVFHGSWVIQGTKTPLAGSPAAGLYLLAAGTGVMMVSIVWVRVLVVRGRPLRQTLGSPAVNYHRECPHCRERMRTNASVCPHCRRDVPPHGTPSPDAAYDKPAPLAMPARGRETVSGATLGLPGGWASVVVEVDGQWWRHLSDRRWRRIYAQLRHRYAVWNSVVGAHAPRDPFAEFRRYSSMGSLSLAARAPSTALDCPIH